MCGTNKARQETWVTAGQHELFCLLLCLFPKSPQCQEATHTLLQTQPFRQQPLHQRVVMEQPLHTKPQSQSQPQSQLQSQLLFLQKLQPELIVELHLWVPQSQPESGFFEEAKESPALMFSCSETETTFVFVVRTEAVGADAWTKISQHFFKAICHWDISALT